VNLSEYLLCCHVYNIHDLITDNVMVRARLAPCRKRRETPAVLREGEPLGYAQVPYEGGVRSLLTLMLKGCVLIRLGN